MEKFVKVLQQEVYNAYHRNVTIAKRENLLAIMHQC